MLLQISCLPMAEASSLRRLARYPYHLASVHGKIAQEQYTLFIRFQLCMGGYISIHQTLVRTLSGKYLCLAPTWFIFVLIYLAFAGHGWAILTPEYLRSSTVRFIWVQAVARRAFQQWEAVLELLEHGMLSLASIVSDPIGPRQPTGLRFHTLSENGILVCAIYVRGNVLLYFYMIA